MLGWKSRKDNGTHFQPKTKKPIQGVQSSVESKGVVQHKFLKRNDNFSESTKEKTVSVDPIMLPKIKVEFKLKERVPVRMGDDEHGKLIGYANKYYVKVNHDGNTQRFDFTDSVANTNEGKEPEANDLLYSLVMDYFSPDDEDDFFGEMGYDKDSRKAYKIYQAVQDEKEKINKLFSEEQIQKMDEELRQVGY